MRTRVQLPPPPPSLGIFFMDKQFKSISKIKISNLLNKYDVEWDLAPDINVLSGINGSGKSTILQYIYHSFHPETLDTLLCDELILFGNDGCEFNSRVDFYRDQKKQETPPYSKIRNFYHAINFLSPKINFINTFDIKLEDIDAAKVVRLSDVNVKTTLDIEISKLQKEYLNYQVDISKKFETALRSQNYNLSENQLQKITEKKDRFLEIVDELFLATAKKIDRNANEITFLHQEEKLSPYLLSSGEKQLLIVLLTVLVQDCQPAILIMDEPEISLHFDWQRKLISIIRELNPFVQIILATHSPAIIMDGWFAKVTNIEDILKPKK